MAQIYSHRFQAIVQGSSAPYYVPAGNLAVIRSITAYNSDTVNRASFNVVVGAQALHVVGQYLQPLGTTGQQHEAWYDVRVVVLAGEQIWMQASPTVDGTVSGYLFVS